MSTLHRLGTLILCVLVGSSGSSGTPRLSARTTSACIGLAVSWREDAQRIDLANGVCFSLDLPRLIQYAACWPRPSATRGRSGDRANATALTSFLAGLRKRPSVAPTCAAHCPYLYVVVSSGGSPESIAITSCPSAVCKEWEGDLTPRQGSRWFLARTQRGTLVVGYSL